jgi:hypothetical protein
MLNLLCYGTRVYIFDDVHITNNKIIFPNFLVSSCDSAERESNIPTNTNKRKWLAFDWSIIMIFFFGWGDDIYTLSP